jgi:hypothetical protein
VLFDPVTKLQLPISLANTEQARATLLDWLAERSAQLVIPDTLLGQPFLNQASHTPVVVWIAPSALLEAIRFTTGLTTRAPKQTAALLARWPTAPALRPFLRRLTASRSPTSSPCSDISYRLRLQHPLKPPPSPSSQRAREAGPS